MRKVLGVLAVFASLFGLTLAACKLLGGEKKPARLFAHKIHVQDQQMECVACHSKAGTEGPGSSRRHFFRQMAAAVVAPQGKASANEPAVARRRRLVQAVCESGRKFAAIRASSVRLAGVTISDDCLGCNVCEHVCALVAITREEAKDGRVTLKFDPGLCVDCGACAEACMPKAIALAPAADLAAPPRTLATLAPRDCTLCGVSFHSSKTDVCPRGRKFAGNGHA